MRHESVFDAPLIVRKYTVAAITFIALGGAIMCLGVLIWILSREAVGHGTTLFPTDPGFEYVLTALIFGPFVVGPVVTFLHLRRTAREKYLYMMTNGRELVVSDEKLKASIGLIAGSSRAKLRRLGNSYLILKWSEIEQFEILPRHYRVSRFKQEPIFITRKPFFEREDELTTILATYLPRPLTRATK